MLEYLIGKVMMSIRSDISKNRLYLAFSGRFDLVEVKEIGESIYNEIRNLHPGFDIVTDLSDFVPAADDSRTEMMEIMVKMKSMGLRKVVRIVKFGISSHQWQRVSKSAGYTANEVSNMDEADILLDELTAKN